VNGKSHIDVIAALSYIAGGGLVSVAVGIGTLVPHYQFAAVAISGIVIGVAGLLVRLFGNPTPTRQALVTDQSTQSPVEVDVHTTAATKGP
jgi:hypothetical protein